jgi:hypothetical protein
MTGIGEVDRLVDSMRVHLYDERVCESSKNRPAVPICSG